MKRIGSVYTNDSGTRPGIGRNHLFKAVNKRTDTGDKGTVDAFIQIFFFLATKIWSMKRNKLICSINFMNKIDELFKHCKYPFYIYGDFPDV